MQRKKRLGLVAFAALALIVSGASLLATDGETAPEVKGPQIEASATVPGTDQVVHAGASASEEAKAVLNQLAMMAFVDAETGALRAPTIEEAQQLAAAGQQLQSIHGKARMEVRQFTTESGAVGAELPQELYAMSHVHLGNDGELSYGCTDTEAPRHGGVIVPATQEEEE